MNEKIEVHESPLQKLYTDKKALRSRTEELLAQLLGQFLEIEKESGQFYFRQCFYKLSSRDQVLILLYGQLARNLLGIDEEVGLRQRDISAILTNIPEGTIKSNLHGLRKSHLVKISGGLNIAEERKLDSLINEFSKKGEVPERPNGAVS